jgi:hypothetical protein
MTTENTTQTAETTETTQELPKLTAQQEINALRSVHEFLSAFDRVPGGLAGKWSQVLDTVAVVANSLIGKAQANGELSADTTTEATTTTNTTVTQ